LVSGRGGGKAWCPPKIRGQRCRPPRLLTEVLSAKAAFTKTCASAAPRASSFGPEHVFFEALKSLVGKDRRMSLKKAAEEEKSRLLFEFNQEALSKPSEVCQLKTRKPRKRMDKERQGPASSRYESHAQENPDCTSRYLLEAAHPADLGKRQTLMVRRERAGHGEERQPSYRHRKARETHVEVVVMHEMVRVLKNSIAKKAGAARFRSLLWFDLSLLPELLGCGEQMASFSLLKDHLRLTLGRTVALAIASRQLDHNPNRFMGLLGRLKSAAGKDLGKTAHIMRMTKTIEHTKFVCAREGRSVLSLPVHQTLRNWRKIRHCKIRGTVAADLLGGRGGTDKALHASAVAAKPRPGRALHPDSRFLTTSFLSLRPGTSEDMASSDDSVIWEGTPQRRMMCRGAPGRVFSPPGSQPTSRSQRSAAGSCLH
ncbi:LOW QUALITY PROTEIN: testis-expressed protein 15, partial [Sarcoramphus papa]